jgi:hypothetical protein
MTEESKELSDIHLELTHPIYLDVDTSETILDIYTMAVLSRGMRPDTVVDCRTAHDVLAYLHWLFCPEHMGESND